MISVFASFVSAQTSGDVGGSVENALNVVIAAVSPILKYTLGDTGLDNNPELFFIKVLLFVLMIAVVYTAADRIPGVNASVALIWTITIVVSILAARFLTTEALINFVWLPSGVVGVALASFLPFILYFFFLEGFNSRIIRKVGWVFFAVLFFGLAYTRWDTLVSDGFNLGWIYIITAVLSGIMVLADRKIRMVMFRSSLDSGIDRTKRIRAGDIHGEIDDLWGKYAKASGNNTLQMDIKSQIDAKQEALNKLLK